MQTLYLLLRALYTGCFVAAFVLLVRHAAPRRIMQLISAGTLLFSGFMGLRFWLGHGLAEAPGHLGIDVLAIVGFYLLHQPMAVRVFAGLLVAASSAVDFIVNQQIGQAGATLLLLTLTLANVLGFTVAASMERALQFRYDMLQEILLLRSNLPICAWCKSIRDDSGTWKQLESYLQEHADMMLTHGVCPNCAAKLEAEAG